MAGGGLEAVVRTSASVLIAGFALLLAALADARHAERSGADWLDGREREGAAGTAALFARLSSHFRASGGDPRFSDRIPADPPVIAELQADVAFARHGGLVERPRLVKFEALEVVPDGPGFAKVRATEYWITQTEGPEEPSVRSDVVSVRYAMRRDAAGWRVADWILDGGVRAAKEPAR